MKVIIAPTDFSSVSLNAVNYAADMATMLDAHLILFHVYAIPMAVHEVTVPGFDSEQLKLYASARIDLLKHDLLVRTNKRILIQTEVRSGEVLAGLTDFCAKIKPHAVVIGAETAPAFERFIFGGTTVAAVRKLQWPLIIVPPLAKFRNIRKIGLACDLKEVIESVRVDELKELVNEFKAELHVLHVSEEVGERFSPRTIEESGLLQEMLDELHPKYDFINGADVEQGIIDFAERNQLDLLIIVPKKHHLLRRIFSYSHSRQLVLHAEIPVMAIHE